jgi:hypothetical protein
MNPPSAAQTAPPLTPSKVQTDPLRQWLAIEQSERLVAFAQTASGKFCLYGLAYLAVLPLLSAWTAALCVTAAWAVMAYADQRARILFMASWGLTLFETATDDNDFAEKIQYVLAQEHYLLLSPELLAVGALLMMMGGLWLAMQHAISKPDGLLSRRPFVCMLAVEVALLVLSAPQVDHGLLRVLVWSMLVVFTPFVWFFPLAIADLRGRAADPPAMQMAVQRPFWSHNYLPFGKGAGYLRKHFSPLPREQAITHIKGVKLLLWANLLLLLSQALTWFFSDYLALPRLINAIDAFVEGQPLPIATGWEVLIYGTFRYALQIAIWAHLFIGLARMAGYRLPRGSWRPLESRTLMEYFNRFHFYFKEILVDLFFIPTFFKVFRQHPRLRMFTATFMAAGVGNALWHFMADIHLVAVEGLWGAISSFSSYLFYSFVLAIGVGLSQVRASMGYRPSATLAGRLYAFLFIWSFVVLLRVFSDGTRDHTFEQRLRFLLSLFGLN